jgi:hypothetical protein
MMVDKEEGRRWFLFYYDSAQTLPHFISITNTTRLAVLRLYKVVPLILGPVLLVIDAPFGRFYSNTKWSVNGMLPFDYFTI